MKACDDPPVPQAPEGERDAVSVVSLQRGRLNGGRIDALPADALQRVGDEAPLPMQLVLVPKVLEGAAAALFVERARGLTA